MMEPPPSRRDLLAGAAVVSLASCAAAPRAASQSEPESADTPALDFGLGNQLALGEPITANEHAARRARLGELLAREGVDAFVTEPGATLEYLSGVAWGRSERLFALVVFADGSAAWIAPAFEVSRAERRFADAALPEPDRAVVGWDEDVYPWRPLAELLRARGVERVALEPSTRLFASEGLGAAFGAERVVSGASLTRELRGRKDTRELALMRTANELTQRAIAAVAERLEPGLTGGEIGGMIRAAHRAMGFESPWVLALIGPDAALPHGGSGERRLAPGDPLLIDCGGSFHAYQSDITRTWVPLGEPTAEFARAWRTVRDAQQRAFETLRPGVPCNTADARAREVIAAAGYGAGYSALTHRLGHGIGMEGHEQPYLDGGNALLLEPGMTFSDEPGIYREGEFGVRIEDIVVITEDGADHFGAWQTSPRRPA